MCLYCHLGETSESSVRSLRNALENPEFEIWNTTSLSHVLLAVRGLDGSEAHELGCQLIEQFYDWFLGKTNGYWEYFTNYFPSHGFEPFPTIKEIRQMIDEAYEFYEKHHDKTRDEMIQELTGGKTEKEIRERND